MAVRDHIILTLKSRGRQSGGQANRIVEMDSGTDDYPASCPLFHRKVGVSVPRLAPNVPWLLGGVIGTAIAALGTVTGGCVNPARQFGPAIFAGHFEFLATYLLAPLVGASAAVWLLGHAQHRTVLTHKLCGPRDDAAHSSDVS